MSKGIKKLIQKLWLTSAGEEDDDKEADEGYAEEADDHIKSTPFSKFFSKTVHICKSEEPMIARRQKYRRKVLVFRIGIVCILKAQTLVVSLARSSFLPVSGQRLWPPKRRSLLSVFSLLLGGKIQ